MGMRAVLHSSAPTKSSQTTLRSQGFMVEIGLQGEMRSAVLVPISGASEVVDCQVLWRILAFTASLLKKLDANVRSGSACAGGARLAGCP